MLRIIILALTQLYLYKGTYIADLSWYLYNCTYIFGTCSCTQILWHPYTTVPQLYLDLGAHYMTVLVPTPGPPELGFRDLRARLEELRLRPPIFRQQLGSWRCWRGWALGACRRLPCSIGTVYLHTYMQTNMYTNIHVCIYVYTSVCVCVYVYVYTHTHIYMNTYRK